MHRPALFATLILATLARAADPISLQAFDHLSDIGDQSQTAAASGASLLYVSGIGPLGYQGLPPQAQLDAAIQHASTYATTAHTQGIPTLLAYQCATSICNLDSFDKNWPDELRRQFMSPPKDWLQQDATGKPLPSWYGPPYFPACMNNPDWRTYQKYFLKFHLTSHHDGIFFDNPTVHPNGCYCPHCMKKFAQFLHTSEPASPQLAQSHPKEFLRFRAQIASDFLADMRTYARTINPNALITCNNSLNTPDAFFSQVRTYGYDIHALSQVEDLIVIEDMATQPRTLPSGATIEYAPTYELLNAISHHKPIATVTLADADYHTPPNLMRLAYAEALAHNATYLSWPTWPAEQRPRLSAALKLQSDFVQAHADLFTNTTPVIDAALFLPYRRWTDTDTCQTLSIARSLSASNIQYKVITEDDLATFLHATPPPALLLESPEQLTPEERTAVEAYRSANHPIIYTSTPNWLTTLRSSQSLVTLSPDKSLRATLRQKGSKTILHLLNLNTRKLNSYEDQTTPATNIHLTLRLPTAAKSITALTADPSATTGPIPFTAADNAITLTLPRVDISTLLVIE